MGHAIKVPVPTDDGEFEKAVINAVQRIIADGSRTFVAQTVARYNHWPVSNSTGSRIAHVLLSRGYVGTRVSPSKRWYRYSIPAEQEECKMAALREPNHYMGGPEPRSFTHAPDNSDEFDNAVMNAVANIIRDGSQTFFVRTVARYCGWRTDRRTRSRIVVVLKSHGAVSERRSPRCATHYYRMPERWIERCV